MDFSDLLAKRRSVRDYEEKEVPLDLVREIITESCLAPSSGNGQPWRFVIIRDRRLIKRLSDENKMSILSHIEKNPEAPIAKYRDAIGDPGFNIFYNAPCLLYIAGPKELNSLQIDCSLAACYLMFSASNHGLGTCWIGLGSFLTGEKMEELVGLPKAYQAVAPIILGYPRDISGAVDRMEPQIVRTIP